MFSRLEISMVLMKLPVISFKWNLFFELPWSVRMLVFLESLLKLSNVLNQALNNFLYQFRLANLYRLVGRWTGSQKYISLKVKNYSLRWNSKTSLRRCRKQLGDASDIHPCRLCLLFYLPSFSKCIQHYFLC